MGKIQPGKWISGALKPITDLGSKFVSGKWNIGDLISGYQMVQNPLGALAGGALSGLSKGPDMYAGLPGASPAQQKALEEIQKLETEALLKNLPAIIAAREAQLRALDPAQDDENFQRSSEALTRAGLEQGLSLAAALRGRYGDSVADGAVLSGQNNARRQANEHWRTLRNPSNLANRYGQMAQTFNPNAPLNMAAGLQNLTLNARNQRMNEELNRPPTPLEQLLEIGAIAAPYLLDGGVKAPAPMTPPFDPRTSQLPNKWGSWLTPPNTAVRW